MPGSDSLKLVAHRSGFDLLFSVAELVEIVATEDLVLEPEDDSGLRTCRFRGELLSLPDFSRWLGEPPSDCVPGGHLLVVAGKTDPFGILVQQVSGIFPADRFRYRDLPYLLRDSERQCYVRLALGENRVLICCDGVGLEACSR